MHRWTASMLYKYSDYCFILIGSWTRDYYVTTTATVSQLPVVITATIVVWYASSGPGDLI
jgi:hypothetical protein